MIEIPKFMKRNIILLNKQDFGDEIKGDHKSQIEIFKINYINDESTINKIKIIN